MRTWQAMPPKLTALPYAKQLERVAAMVVAAETGLTLKCLDPGGGSTQLPDFSMRDNQETIVGVLEVTTTTVARRAQFAARARKHDWAFAELAWAWIVHVTGEAQPCEIRKVICPLLLALENAGRTGDWIPAQPGLTEADPGALPRDLAGLGIRQVCAFSRPEHGPGTVVLRQAGPAGFLSLNAVTDAADYELHKKDNVAKLSGVNGRAELFV